MKAKKSFIWLGILLLATIWILVRKNNVPYHSINGLVFGTIYNITYQYDGDLKSEIEAELKRFDGSLSPFNDTSIISRINRNEAVVPASFFHTCITHSMDILEETNSAFDIPKASLANLWGFGLKTEEIPD